MGASILGALYLATHRAHLPPAHTNDRSKSERGVLTKVLCQLGGLLLRREFLGALSEENNPPIDVRAQLVEHLLRHGKGLLLPLEADCSDPLDPLRVLCVLVAEVDDHLGIGIVAALGERVTGAAVGEVALDDLGSSAPTVLYYPRDELVDDLALEADGGRPVRSLA